MLIFQRNKVYFGEGLLQGLPEFVEANLTPKGYPYRFFGLDKNNHLELCC